MFHYHNEAAFSKALVTHLRKKNWFVQRIESGTTGKGIPDIYAVSPTGKAVWLELKRVTRDMPAVDIIQWRPGQQVWLHGISTRYKQLAYTLVCYNDCIVQIPHNHVYSQNLVQVRACKRFYSLSQI